MHIKVPAGKLNVRRQNCFRLVMRSQVPGPTHGQWQPVASHGYEVICASKKDAIELKLRLGGAYFPASDGYVDDDAYEAYLDRYIKIQPCEWTGRRQLWDYDLYRGWVPTADEMARGSRESAEQWQDYMDLQRAALRNAYLNQRVG